MNYQANVAASGLILVEIDGSGIVEGRTYTDKQTNVQKPLPGQQAAFIWQGDRYPIRVSIDIPTGRGPYRPGAYMMGGGVFEPGKYGRLEFKGARELTLVPLDEAVTMLTGMATAADPPAKPKVAA